MVRATCEEIYKRWKLSRPSETGGNDSKSAQNLHNVSILGYQCLKLQTTLTDATAISWLCKLLHRRRDAIAGGMKIAALAVHCKCIGMLMQLL